MLHIVSVDIGDWCWQIGRFSCISKFEYQNV